VVVPVEVEVQEVGMVVELVEDLELGLALV
jgi:hypothetical protein